MMRRFIALLLCAVMLSPCMAIGREAEEEAATEEAQEEDILSGWDIPEEPPWTGVTANACRIYEEPSQESKAVYRIPETRRFRMYAFDPAWAYVEYAGKKGFIRRNNISHAEPVDASVTPPYGVDVYRYTAVIDGQADVYPDEGEGEALITLYDGARVALIGFENGWGKLIFHRQYGYIDSNLLREVTPVYPEAETAGSVRPISAFVSFYKITDDEANLGRMINIAVACEKLSAMVFQPGDYLDFNDDIGPYNQANGYQKAIVLVNGESALSYGGGTCQVSSTLYNAVLQLPGLTVTMRTAHGPSGASYLPHGVDAAVGNSRKGINFKFRNDYDFPIRIDATAQDGALYMAVYRVEPEI